MKSFLITFSLLLSLFVYSQKRITLSGAFALYPITVKWAEEFKKTHPSVEIDISAGGAGKGITDALSGQVIIALVSRDLTPQEIKNGGYPIAVAKDAVLPTINTKNPSIETILKTGIKKSVLNNIFITGKSKVWNTKTKAPIHVYTRSDAAGAAETWAKYFEKKQEDLLGVAVYGAFAFTLMIFFGIHTSLLAGIIAVSFLVTPIMIRTIDEVVQLTPDELYNVIYSMGTTRLEASKVILKQSVSGILTALLLSFGRAIGDAASVLFTAGYTDNIPTSLDQPTATLPLAVFFQLSSPIEEVQGRAYASAVILTIIVLILSFASKYFSGKLSKFKI